MNIIPQISMFGEKEFEELGDLERLKTVLGVIPDEKLIGALYRIRGQGRNDWPCEAMWNSFVASFMFEHPTVEALLRELRRNKQLREICGFVARWHKQPDGTIKVYTAPSESAYSKFLKNLTACKSELKEIFENLVQYMYDHLDGFGEDLMSDGKAIQSFAIKLSERKASDHRGEHDADWCKKSYTVSEKHGEKKTKEVKWFGFRLHLIADANYELPVAFTVTKASNSEQKETEKQLKEMKQAHPKRLEKCKYFMADKGYDSSKLINLLEDNDIIPIIDIRNCWKDDDPTRQYRNTDLVYDYQGNVWYVKDDGSLEKLLYRGYDKGTDSLRYGFHPRMKDHRIFRIKCDEDRRIFTPVARDSKKWKRLYNKRSGIERINGRIDRDYKFEKHTIRGLAKMDMFISVTLIVYLSMAKVKISRGVTEHLGRLYA